MSPYKAVIFDIGGVLVPQPQIGIRQYGEELNLPPSFLGKVFIFNAPDNAFCKLERGELLFSEFIGEFDKEVKEAGQREGIDLGSFETSTLFERMADSSRQFRKEMLHAVKVLSCNGFKTCALTNNWIDDRDELNELSSKVQVTLQQFFDLVMESSKIGIRKPDLEIYKLACEKLQVEPNEVIFLDDIGENLKGASKLGIKCIKVESSSEALNELQKLTGVKILTYKPPLFVYPPPCKPQDVPHAFVSLKSGIRIHYVDVGNGPVVMFFHGFPESWYSWRHQIPALVAAGYRVIVPDQRGYGDSSIPYEIKEYTQKKICEDGIGLMDALGISKCVVVGHDWGGQVVWSLGLFYPDRLNGICSVNTPFFTGEGLKKLQQQPEIFNYQIYFQKPGVAERELEENLERTFNIFFQAVDDETGGKMMVDTTNSTENGGMMVNCPKDVPRSKLLSKADLEYYVERFKKNGFRGPLNWYRNTEANIISRSTRANRKIHIPCMMVTSSHDIALKPEFTLGMEEIIPKLTRLDLQRCSHWTQMEKPDELNDGLIKWLDSINKAKLKA